MAGKGARAAETQAKQALSRLREFLTVPPTLDLMPILALLPHKLSSFGRALPLPTWTYRFWTVP